MIRKFDMLGTELQVPFDVFRLIHVIGDLALLQQVQQQMYNNDKSETTADHGKVWTAAQSKVISILTCSHVSKAVKGL